jgi:AraC-like DNA-binding protein
MCGYCGTGDALRLTFCADALIFRATLLWSQPVIRSTILAGYSDLTRSLGGHPQRLLRASGINPRLETDPDGYVGFAALCELLERTADETGCESFGLRLSEAQGLASLGPLGFALQNSATIREAIEEYGLFQSVHLQGAHSEFSQTGPLLQWLYHVDEPGRLGTRQKVAQALGLACNVFRALLGPAWKPIGVHFMQPEPADTSDFRRLFRSRVWFDQHADLIELQPDVLDRPIERSNPELRRLIDRHLLEMKTGVSEALDEQVRKVMRSSISRQDCSIEEVAAILSVAPRTLQRQLQQHGTSFSRLLETVRAEAARRYLTESQLSLTQLAAILGYSELSAFSRAFRRWHGQSPQQWQRARTSVGEGDNKVRRRGPARRAGRAVSR